MSLNLDLDNSDEHVFEFDSFELVMHNTGNYLLCEEGFFVITGLENFCEFNEGYVIVNENDKFFITADDFEKIKEIWVKNV